jgi:hypothetical protein
MLTYVFFLMIVGIGCPTFQLQQGEPGGPASTQKAPSDAGVPSLTVESKAFFPLGWYSNLDASKLPIMKAGGMNAVIPYSGKSDEEIARYLDAAAKEGIKVMVEVSREELTAINSGKKSFSGILTRIRNLKGKKNLLGWYLVDEPHGKGITPSTCKVVYDSIKAVDPGHPIFIVDTEWGWTGQWDSDPTLSYAIACDVAMWDEYPLMDTMATMPHRLGRVAETSRKTREVAGREARAIPMMAALQAYGLKDKKGKENYAVGDVNRRRNPAYDELRYMTYSSIIHGARGLFYWVHYRADSLLEAHVHNVVQELHANQIPELAYGRDLGALVSHAELDADGELKDKNDSSLLFREKDGAYYLVVVNDSRQTLETVRFTVDSSLVVGSVTRLDKGKPKGQVNRSGNTFEDRFTQFEVKLYRIDVRKGS